MIQHIAGGERHFIGGKIGQRDPAAAAFRGDEMIARAGTQGGKIIVVLADFAIDQAQTDIPQGGINQSLPGEGKLLFQLPENAGLRIIQFRRFKVAAGGGNPEVVDDTAAFPEEEKNFFAAGQIDRGRSYCEADNGGLSDRPPDPLRRSHFLKMNVRY